jgi:hypothetical protein
MIEPAFHSIGRLELEQRSDMWARTWAVSMNFRPLTSDRNHIRLVTIVIARASLKMRCLLQHHQPKDLNPKGGPR